MKKPLVYIVVILFFLVAGSLCSFAQEQKSGPSVKIGGFTQATMIKSEGNKAFVFGFDRVRLIAKGKLNSAADYKLQVDFFKTATDVDKDGDTPGIIKDAEITFKPGKKLKVSVGKFKTPIGMEFNTSGMKLDFVKRGLGQALVFERNTGVMLHAKGIGKADWGGVAGLFNYGPNGANNIGDPSYRQDYTIAGRVSVNPKKVFYAQAYFGSALTSVSGQENVDIFGVGAKVKLAGKLQLKGEFMSRSDKQNTAADGTDFYVQGGFLIHPNFEPVIKYEKLDVKMDSKDQADITLGVNIFLNPGSPHQSKIQVNYVLSDLEGKDAIQLMFQGAF